MDRRRILASLLLGIGLAGCGGGLYIGFDDGGFGPPSVSLAAAVQTVAAGGTVHVVAAASADSGIDEVALYRLDAGVPVFVASDRRAPFEWDVAVPDDGRSSLHLFARVTDGAGEQADSAELVLAVTR